MPYLGYNITNAGSFALIDDIASTFNGSNTAFTLQVGGVNITPNVQNLLIAIDGVVQQAPDAYSVSGSTITFTGAPASGADFYGVLMGQSSYVENNSITADELAVSGDGSSGQLLSSDGDGTFSWLSSSSITSVGTLSSLTVSGVASLGNNSKVTSSSADTTFKIETTSGTTIFPVLDFVSSHSSVGAKIRQDGSDVITIDNDQDVTFVDDVTISGNTFMSGTYLSINDVGYIRSASNELRLQTGSSGLNIMNNAYNTSLLSIGNTGTATFSGNVKISNTGPGLQLIDTNANSRYGEVYYGTRAFIFSNILNDGSGGTEALSTPEPYFDFRFATGVSGTYTTALKLDYDLSATFAGNVTIGDKILYTASDYLKFAISGTDRLWISDATDNWGLNFTGNSPYGMQITTNSNGSSSHDAFVIKRQPSGGSLTKVFEIFNNGEVKLYGNIIPQTDNAYDLGSSSLGWRNIYTNDLNLSNMDSDGNDVDGTKGSWTIQEGEDDLFLINRTNGKKYKFKLEMV